MHNDKRFPLDENDVAVCVCVCCLLLLLLLLLCCTILHVIVFNLFHTFSISCIFYLSFLLFCIIFDFLWELIFHINHIIRHEVSDFPSLLFFIHTFFFSSFSVYSRASAVNQEITWCLKYVCVWVSVCLLNSWVCIHLINMCFCVYVCMSVNVCIFLSQSWWKWWWWFV